MSENEPKGEKLKSPIETLVEKHSYLFQDTKDFLEGYMILDYKAQEEVYVQIQALDMASARLNLYGRVHEGEFTPFLRDRALYPVARVAKKINEGIEMPGTLAEKLAKKHVQEGSLVPQRIKRWVNLIAQGVTLELTRRKYDRKGFLSHLALTRGTRALRSYGEYRDSCLKVLQESQEYLIRVDKEVLPLIRAQTTLVRTLAAYRQKQEGQEKGTETNDHRGERDGREE